MRNIFALLSLQLVCVVLYGQERLVPKSELPDLWVVVVDESGSMLNPNGEGWSSRHKATLAQEVVSQFTSGFPNRNGDTSRFNVERDRLLFLSSGMVTRDSSKKVDSTSSCCDKGIGVCLYWIEPVGSTLRPDESLESQYIHYQAVSEEVYAQYASMDDLTEGLSSQIQALRYSYQYSFVTLVKLYALKHLLTYQAPRKGLETFNRLYFLIVSDDKDQNDRMGTDAKTLQACAPFHYARTLELFDQYETSPFNTSSKRLGAFNELFTTRTPQSIRPWNLHLYQYTTVQDSLLSEPIDQLLDISFINDSSLRIRKKQELYKGDSLSFIQLDSIRLGGSDLAIGQQQLVDELIFPVNVQSSKDSLSLHLSGYLQINYADELLGNRVRNVLLGESNQHLAVRSPFAPRLWKWWEIASMAVLIPAVLLGIFTLILHQTPLFHIYDGQGNSYTIYWRISFFFRKQELHIAHFVDKFYTSILAPTAYIRTNKQQAEGVLEGNIYIVSKRRLLFSTDYINDIDHIPAGSDPLQFSKEYNDEFILGRRYVNKEIYKIRFVENGLDGIKLTIFHGLGPSFKISFEQADQIEDTRSKHQHASVLTQHTLAGNKERHIILLQDKGDLFNWSVIRLHTVKGDIRKADWLIDYQQPKTYFEELTRSEQADKLARLVKLLAMQLKLKNDVSYYIADMPASKPFIAVEEFKDQCVYTWEKSHFPSFLYLLAFINNSEDKWITERQIVVDEPGNLCLYNPLTMTKWKDIPVEMQAEGEFKLYQSLFPDYKQALSHPDSIRLISDLPFLSYSSEISYLTIEQTANKEPSAISFLDETVEL